MNYYVFMLQEPSKPYDICLGSDTVLPHKTSEHVLFINPNPLSESPALGQTILII